MKTIQPIHIGIIGGMGPQASALLHTQIIRACTNDLGITECHEFPLITHVSIPAVDFISQPELRSLNTKLLRTAIAALQVTKLDVAVIACNTAHLLLEEIPEMRALPLISLPESVLVKAKDNGVSRLGLIATPTTIKTGLYAKHAATQGIEVIVPNPSALQKAERIIRATIAGKAGEHEFRELRRLINELKRRGAEQVALGCTELSVVMQQSPATDVIDSLTATTEAVTATLRSLRQEPSHV